MALHVAVGRAPQRQQAPKEKAPDLAAGALGQNRYEILLDLRFLEFDVLLDDRIILRLGHFFGHRAAVLGRDVEIARVGRRQQLDLDGGSFRHGRPAFIEK
jgi:hypothetical protein